MTKYYLCKYSVRDGENEYYSSFIVRALSINAARKIAVDCSTYNDYRIVEVYDITEINKREYNIFKKYGC